MCVLRLLDKRRDFLLNGIERLGAMRLKFNYISSNKCCFYSFYHQTTKRIYESTAKPTNLFLYFNFILTAETCASVPVSGASSVIVYLQVGRPVRVLVLVTIVTTSTGLLGAATQSGVELGGICRIHVTLAEWE